MLSFLLDCGLLIVLWFLFCHFSLLCVLVDLFSLLDCLFWVCRYFCCFVFCYVCGYWLDRFAFRLLVCSFCLLFVGLLIMLYCAASFVGL